MSCTIEVEKNKGATVIEVQDNKNMQEYKLYIVLTRPQTVLSWLIRLIKKDKYTHAAISMDRELKQMYSFGRKVYFNPFVGGFVQERLDQGLYKLHKILPGVVLELEVSKEQYAKANYLLNCFIQKPKSYKYNYLGLIFSLFQKEAYCRSRFLCSEFVYYILKESGIIDLKISGNLVRPQSFMDIKAKIIYQGNLKHYNLESCCYIRKNDEKGCVLQAKKQAMEILPMP